VVTRRPFARFRKLAADQGGLAAVEFALVLPIMVLLLFGTVELGDALTISDKVNFVTSTLGDLVTQSKEITDTDMANIFNAAGSIITPYPVSNLRMIVSGVNIDASSNATVAWSYAQNGTALTNGSTVSLPSALVLPSTFLVVSEVHYSYAPTIGYVMAGTFDLKSKFYLNPRVSAKVCQNTSSC
jgi:Flp pilus assembly protein TadG